MIVTFPDTNPVEYSFIPGRTNYISATGGSLTIERKTAAGSWVEVSGSPVLDGEEKFLLTYSVGNKIRVTASTAGVEMTLEQ